MVRRVVKKCNYYRSGVGRAAPKPAHKCTHAARVRRVDNEQITTSNIQSSANGAPLMRCLANCHFMVDREPPPGAPLLADGQKADQSFQNSTRPTIADRQQMRLEEGRVLAGKPEGEGRNDAVLAGNRWR